MAITAPTVLWPDTGRGPHILERSGSAPASSEDASSPAIGEAVTSAMLISIIAAACAASIMASAANDLCCDAIRTPHGMNKTATELDRRVEYEARASFLTRFYFLDSPRTKGGNVGNRYFACVTCTAESASPIVTFAELQIFRTASASAKKRHMHTRNKKPSKIEYSIISWPSAEVQQRRTCRTQLIFVVLPIVAKKRVKPAHFLSF